MVLPSRSSTMVQGCHCTAPPRCCSCGVVRLGSLQSCMRAEITRPCCVYDAQSHDQWKASMQPRSKTPAEKTESSGWTWLLNPAGLSLPVYSQPATSLLVKAADPQTETEGLRPGFSSPSGKAPGAGPCEVVSVAAALRLAGWLLGWLPDRTLPFLAL